MLMILARLVRSESFWAVVKVRSPHTGPEVCYIIELVDTRQGHATTHTPPWRRRRQSQPLRSVSLPRLRWGSPPRSVRSPVCFSMVVRRARSPTSPPSLFRLRPRRRLVFSA